jgi:hypothetical protein
MLRKMIMVLVVVGACLSVGVLSGCKPEEKVESQEVTIELHDMPVGDPQPVVR